MGVTMAIKQLAKTDKAERATSLSGGDKWDGKTIRCIRTVKADEDATSRCVVDWTFNIEGVSPGEIMGLAARALVIDTQRVWRGSKDRLTDSWGTRTISVRTMIDTARSRTTVDPATAAGRAVTKMTDAEKRALLERIEAELTDE